MMKMMVIFYNGRFYPTPIVPFWSLWSCFSLLSVVNAEKKRLRKPSKRLLEYAEEYDHIFASKKKKKNQESFQKVGVESN